MDFSAPNAGGVYGDRYVHETWETWSARYLSPAGKDVVDIGCGAGIYAGGFARLGARTVTGVDVTQQYILEAGAQYAGAANMSFVFGSASATGLDSACADLVFQRAVIHHLDDAEQLASARENIRILRICREITRPIRLLLGTASGVARRSNTGVFSLLAPCWQHPSTPSVLGGLFRGRPLGEFAATLPRMQGALEIVSISASSTAARILRSWPSP
jgi:SAM-dependent methyltransferase